MRGAKWAEPIMKADHAWTQFETWLAVLALALEILSMSLWVFLKGFSTPTNGENQAGVVFRSVVGATVLGMAAYFGLKKKSLTVRRRATVAMVILGVLLGKAWEGFGVDYTSNLLNWYQQACFLTLLGGLRGVGTRLTLLLALIGGSLATARGKHIIIDIATRFVSYRPRMAMVVIGWLVSALVSGAAAWGFFDHIAIESFGARADQTAGQKISRVVEQLGEDFFIARKQIALDFKSTPHVLFRGQVYAEWLTGKEWNKWLDESGLPERYGKEAIDGLKIPDDETRAPLIVIPGRGEPRGELINSANLVFPIGLFVIAIRFVVRALLALTGWVSVDPDESDEFPAEEPSEAKA
ncbi:MAG TPA: TRAP transporter small permease subunit [Polyangiaceae bacterium]|nr:TRAP transporter small permease subunit [Polyangiaceae bacterium]